MADSMTYKCPCCGAGLDFHGASGKMKCAYCDSEIDVEELKQGSEFENKGDRFDSFEFNGEERVWDESETDGYEVKTCSSCGGQLITDGNTAATRCVYCGNPTLITERLTGVFRPDYVIPFKLNKNDAKKALKEYYKNKYLLPSLFKDENKISEISGVYVPFWLYDCKTDSSFTYRATRVHTWSDSRYIYTKTDYFRLYRDGLLDFMNIPADASKKMDDTVMESIEPFDYSELKEFDGAYLSGFLADKYDEHPDDCEDRVRQRIFNSIDSSFRNTAIGYSTVTKESTDVRYNEKNVKYALLPVWMLVTKYKDKNYTFAMNGQTGKLVGQLPVDYGKFAAIAGGIAAAVTVVCSLIGLFLM